MNSLRNIVMLEASAVIAKTVSMPTEHVQSLYKMTENKRRCLSDDTFVFQRETDRIK